jgi:putative protein-disulfide isomerase
MDVENYGQKIVKVTYYTHPACEVSWDMQNHWRLFVDQFRDQLTYQFCMSALGPDYSQLLSRKSALGGEGMSSYQSCLAVKAAGLQSVLAADLFLDKLRIAKMTENRDITAPAELVDIARQTSKENPGRFSFHRFADEFYSRNSRQALKSDLQKQFSNKIEILPTLTFTVAGKGIKLTGFQSYEQLVNALQRLQSAAV